MTLQITAILTHAVSQLCHRWLPLPPPSPHERLDPRTLTLSDWMRWIETPQSQMPAWALLMHARQLSPLGLATVVFDNLQLHRASGAHLIDAYHPLFPSELRHIPDPPACLSALGELELLAQPKISIVGSRKASVFAHQEARALGTGLAARGTVVVSGGAMGCDAAAHLGALESRLEPAPTVAVFAGGLARLYPQCLSGLFRRLRLGRALFLSERLWEYPARPYDFPIRNRIIAGLSSSLALMQAGERSGALRTANYALDQGRDVFVLRHESDDIRAFGSNRLIEEGAQPFHSAEDFFSLPGLC